MESHYTPLHLTSRIKKHLPKGIKTVLEPSVGDGALLRALPLSSENGINVSAFDVRNVANFLPKKLLNERGINIQFKHTCFLKWYENKRRKPNFDLVLMNPPFSGKSASWVLLEGRKVPIEIAFLKAAINLCKVDGTIIAILPKSVISGELKCSIEAREFLFSYLNILYCYELTEFEFPSIEGQFYLLIGRKNQNNGLVKIRNMRSGEIKVSRKMLARQGYRLDYSYLESILIIRGLSSNTKLFMQNVSSIADIYRGPLAPPYDKGAVIHTSSYIGHWNINTSTLFNSRIYDTYVRGGDILVKRVGRDCLTSFGMVFIKRKQLATDCILIIRPRSDDFRLPLLLSLRVMYSCDFGKSYLQKGTGAKFISATQLSLAPVILNLFELYPENKSSYASAVKNNDIAKMREIEELIRSEIFENASPEKFSNSNICA